MKEGLTTTQIDQLLAKIKPHPVVALVDDDGAVLDLMERVLEAEGFHVRRFVQAEDLLEKWPRLAPDVVVMEAVLPGMSGLSVLDEIRPKNLEAITPVLILSQKDDPRTKLLAFRRGAMDYLTKPFDTDEFVSRVKALLRSKLLQEMLRLSSTSDPLTQLYNHRFVLQWLELEIERTKRYKADLSCLLMDLDGFKKINEERGESQGDRLLRDFGALLSENIRGSDVAGRLENDRFLLLLPVTPSEGAVVVGKRLRDLARGKKFPTFCTGVVNFELRESRDSSAFLEQAEEALAKARSVGPGETAVVGPA